MKPHRLDSLFAYALALDLETDLIQPGLLAPPMVLGSAAEVGPDGQLHGQILTKDAVRGLFEAVLHNPQIVLCGANIAYDILVLIIDFAKRAIDIVPLVMQMYDPEGTVITGDCDGRVFEILLSEGLHAIAQGHHCKHALSGETIINKETKRPGRYSLDCVTFEVQGREDAKTNDRFRLSYALFHDKPLHELPFEAIQYPIDDAVNTLGNALGQAGHMPSVNHHEWVHANEIPCGVPAGFDTAQRQMMWCRHCIKPMLPETPQACMRKQRRRNQHALSLQTYFAFAAHCGSAWGLNVPQDEVDKLEERIDKARAASIGPFVKAGIIRENGTENQSVLKQLVAVAYGARDICPGCNGEGKVPSPATNGRTKINCPDCDGTKLRLPPQVPRSEGGGVGKSRDVLCESGDELLMEYGEQPSKKIKTTYIPLLRRGRACNVCGRTGVATKYTKAHEEWCTAKAGEAGYRPVPLCPRTDPLKETMRAAIEDGLHSMPRHGGVRECFVARPGYVYSSEDYTAGELVTLAQACLDTVGWSRLADALNAGIDPHLALAGTFCNKPYEVMLAAKKAKESWLDFLRQVAKKSNFGFGGGMGELEFVLKPCRADPDSFTVCPHGPSERKGKRGFNGTRPCIMMDGADYCGRDGDKILVYKDKPTGSPVCKKCLDAGKRAREMYFTQWPEVKELHNHVQRKTKIIGPSGTSEIDYPGLITRGNLGFCDGANTYFQMRLAKAAKAAFCQVQRECMDSSWRVRSSQMMDSKFNGMQSPLLGSRAILLFHDEIVAEHPVAVAPEAAERLSECMVESLRWTCPGMYKAVKAAPTLMPRLYKGADEVRDANGRLIPWEPKEH
jgi:DNA polymerase-1